MRKAVMIGGIVILVVIIAFLCILFLNPYERYQIVHAAFLTGNYQDVLIKPYAICYSNEQLRQAVRSTEVLDRTGMRSFNLDEPDLIACMIANYAIQEVTGRNQIGTIEVDKSAVGGVSFVVVRGKKRLFQFRYKDQWLMFINGSLIATN